MPFLNNDTLDDPLTWAVCPSWSGGQVSFVRANQLEETQSALIDNGFIHLAGLLMKRRGTKNLAEEFVNGEGNRIQALFWWSTATDEALVIFAGGDAFEFLGGTYVPLFTAGIGDVDEAIQVVQLADDLFWTDSGATGIRTWDGTTVSSVATSPVATILESYTNRLIASGDASTPDSVYFSDILDSTTWDVNNIIRVGADGTPVTAVKGWQESLVLIFKEQSTWVIDANPVNTVANMEIRNVHRTVGCLAKKSVVQVGQDLWFLSRTGIQSVQRQFATSNNVIAVPVSQPVHDVVQAINWEYAYKSVAIFYNNIYLLAVPTGSSTEPNTVLAYFYLTQSWATWSGFEVTAWMEQPIEGRTRLILGNSSGEVREGLDNEFESDDPSGPLYVDGPGGITFDFSFPAAFPQNHVVLRMQTRAMEFDEPVNPKSGFYMEAEFKGHYGLITLYAIVDGGTPVFIESFQLGPQSLVLPLSIPFALPGSSWVRKKFPINIEPISPFRSIQIEVFCPQGNIVLRNLILSAYVDTLELDHELMR